MMKPSIKELFYEADTRKHQQLVQEIMVQAAKQILDRATRHDNSKLLSVEREAYVEPVWNLNTKDIPYGSEEYKKQCKMMGEGLKHHLDNNDHHPEYHEDPIYPSETFGKMNLFSLLEMLCNWVAAAQRRGGDPAAPIQRFKEKYGITGQLEGVLVRTLYELEQMMKSMEEE